MSTDLRGDVVRAYASEAQAYKDLWAPVLRPISLELLSTIPRSRRVLDVATGTGTLLPDLRDRVGAEHVVGVDLVPEMVALADACFGRLVGDAIALSFVDECFDLVVLAFVLFHLDDPMKALVEAKRVLAPGGCMGTITWQSDSSTEASTAWNEELDRHGAPSLEPTSNHEPVNSAEKMASLLAGAGLEEVRAWTVSAGEQLSSEAFIERRIRLGVPGRRLAALDDAARQACVATASHRVSQMPPEAFRSEWVLVLATGRRHH